MFIANNGSLKMTISPNLWNSEETPLFNLNYFNLFKVDGGENLAPKFKQVEMNVIMGLQHVASIDGYSYGSTYFNNLSKITQIIIKGEIYLQDHILVWGPESYMQNIIDLGTVESLMSYIKIINESQFDMTGIYLYTHEFVSDYGLHSNNFCIFLSTDGNVDNIYDVEETFIGLVPENSEINNYNFIIDENSCKINIDYENNIINVTQLNEDIQMINYEDQHVFKINNNDVINDTPYDLLCLGYFDEVTQEILLYDDLEILIDEGLVILTLINDNETYITIDEPFGNGSGFYCLFGVNFDSEDDDKINMINMIPVEYFIHSLYVPDNIFSLQNYDGNSKLQIEFEYLNNFYPDIIYPEDIVLSNFICVYECNDIFNYVQKFYFINKFIFPDRLNKLEINNTTNFVGEWYNFPHAQIYNVNCGDAYTSLKTINNCVIHNNYIIRIGENAEIPNNNKLTIIYNDACAYGENLEQIKFPNNIKSVQNGAFGNCNKLSQIEFDVTTPYFSNNAIIDHRISSIKTKNLKNYIETDQGMGFLTYNSSEGYKNKIYDEYNNEFKGNFPKNIEKIGSYVFSKFQNWENGVIIPDSVTSIGDHAFDNLYINSVFIPDSVKFNANGSGFFNNAYITDLSFGPNRKKLNSIFTSTTYYESIPSCIIDKLNLNNIEDVSYYAFKNVRVNKINVNSLDSWLNLKNHENLYNIPSNRGSSLYINDQPIDDYLIIPDHFTTLGGAVFYNINNISTIILPQTMLTIGASAFRASRLTSIIISDSITSIAARAFQDCSNLSEITCNAMTAPTISSNTFQNVKTGGVLRVPTGATGYDAWMSISDYYLGKYGWTIEYI